MQIYPFDRFIIFISIFLIQGLELTAQSVYSEHYYESQRYGKMEINSESDWDTYNGFQPFILKKAAKDFPLNKEVFGWHPYWMGTAYNSYDYSLLTELSYFSYEVDPYTGKAKTMHEWETTPMVDVALSQGIKVSLTITLFDNHEAFLTNSTAIDTLIQTLIAQIKLRNAHGINVDFEAVPSTQKAGLTQFMQKLCTAFHQEIPGSRISIALPAVDWGGVFDVGVMNEFVDLFLIMGYGYHWSGSEEAGPTSPKHSGSIWSNKTVTWSIDDYLNKGIGPEKLCLAVPYYGRDWETSDELVPSAALSTGAAVTFAKGIENYQGFYSAYWDGHSMTPAYIYRDNENKWHQCWIDNAQSLGYKYDLVNLKGIAGIGIWAMGYDGTYPDLNNILAEKFTDKPKTIDSDYFYDTGGPEGFYAANEDWYFTLVGPPDTKLLMVYEQFDTEAGFDSLTVFDGATQLATLMKSYSGSLPVDTLYASSNALCFRFKSNATNQLTGWKALWWSESGNAVFENLNNRNFKAFPNPFQKELTLTIFSAEAQTSEVFITDIKGRLVFSKKVDLKAGPQEILLSLEENLSEGFYIVGVRLGNTYFTERILSQ